MRREHLRPPAKRALSGWSVDATLALALATYIVARSVYGWVAYDQFREMWGAARFVLGFGIPVSGGAAAGVGAASPLTSYLYSAAFFAWFDERAPYIFSSLAMALATLYVFWATKSFSLRFGTLLILASPYRLIDIRSGTDIVFLSAAILTLAAYGIKGKYALKDTKDAFAKGLLLGLLPHLHVSGIFPLAAFLLRFTHMGPFKFSKRNTALYVGASLPLLFWILVPRSIDADSRATVFALGFDHWQSMFFNFFQGVLHHDLTQFRLLNFPAYFAYLYRMTVFAAWVWLMLPILRTRNYLLSLGVLLAFLFAILSRADYVCIALFVVAQPTMLALLPADNRPPARKYYSLLAVLLFQIPLLVLVQETAVSRGFYHVPMTYFAFTEPNAYAGPYPSTLEFHTAQSRADRHAAQSGDRPISSLATYASVGDIMAFFATGMLHLHDLATEDPVCADPTPSLSNYCSVSHTTRMFETLSAWGISFARYLPPAIPFPDTQSKDFVCTLGEFANRQQCPTCLREIQSVPWSYRRSSLGATCISMDSGLGRKLARIEAPHTNYFFVSRHHPPQLLRPQ